MASHEMQGMPKPVADMGIEAMNAMRVNVGNPEELIAEATRLCKSELHVYRGEHRVFGHVSSSIYRKYFDIFQAGGDFLPLNVEMETMQRARHSQYSFETPIEEILTDIRHFGGDTTLIVTTQVPDSLIQLFPCPLSPIAPYRQDIADCPTS